LSFLLLLISFLQKKLEKRAEQFLSGSQGGARERKEVDGRGKSQEAPTMYAHMNK
jgi:hypothetical protein